jgi:2-phospho-L-lactate/phosphoenolpyruvate guanylyltransferase
MWTAIVPLNLGRERKSRLAAFFSLRQRDMLADVMAAHVLHCLAQMEVIDTIIALSPKPPPDHGCSWRRDEGRGLNAELEALRLTMPATPIVVIHGDLPLLKPEDVDFLLAAADASGLALAPDRHETGTNAVALAAGKAFAFAFGAGSFARHCGGLAVAAAIVRRPGLALDVDTPADLAAARDAGFAPQIGL